MHSRLDFSALETATLDFELVEPDLLTSAHHTSAAVDNEPDAPAEIEIESQTKGSQMSDLELDLGLDPDSSADHGVRDPDVRVPSVGDPEQSTEEITDEAPKHGLDEVHAEVEIADAAADEAEPTDEAELTDETAEPHVPTVEFSTDGSSQIFLSNNLPVMRQLPDGAFRVVYLDPPFNTRRTRRAERVRGVKSPLGEPGRLGFRGQGYQVTREMTIGFDDRIHEYWDFLEARLEEAWRLLADDGTLYLHLDYREVHYAKVMLDAMFGPDCFINEIIWAYDYGARTKKRWPTKHDNILVYAKDPAKYFFNAEEVDREPYMAPGLVTPEKAALGKLPTDTWWHTIVSPTGKERTGYPTQKPVGILRRIVQASSRPGDWVLDAFAGSGTTGAAAQQLDRRFVLIDDNPESYAVMRERFAGTQVEFS